MAKLRLLGSVFGGCLISLLLFGCANVPEEAVTLSMTIGQDIEEVHRAHRTLAISYFDRSRTDVERFIDEVYIPALLQKALKESTYEYEEGEPEQEFLYILRAEIIKFDAKEESADPFFYVGVFVREALEKSEARRLDLLETIEAQEYEVLKAIDDASKKIINANAVVTAHLASLRRVQQAQTELLDAAGLEDITNLIEVIAENLNKNAGIMTEVRKESEDIEVIEKVLEDLKRNYSETIAKLKREN